MSKFMDYSIQLGHVRFEGAGLFRPGPSRPPYLEAPEDYVEGSRIWRSLGGTATRICRHLINDKDTNMSANPKMPVKSLANFDKDLAEVSIRGQWQYDEMLERLIYGPKTMAIPTPWKWDVVQRKLMEACDVMQESFTARLGTCSSSTRVWSAAARRRRSWRACRRSSQVRWPGRTATRSRPCVSRDGRRSQALYRCKRRGAAT